jgi:flagellin
VTAPSGSNTDAKISLTINGQNYSTAAGLTSKLGANQTYKLLSETDPNQFIEFTTGDVAIQLDNADKASALEAALNTAFGTADGAASLSFQVGTTTDDTLSVSISDAQSEALFNGATLDVLTQDSAAAAVAAIDVAISNVTAVRATVGALQSRFNFAAANIESSIQNQDAARGTLLDTDIAEESTSYAISQVKLQAGISVLAQANQQLQSLLKLIG